MPLISEIEDIDVLINIFFLGLGFSLLNESAKLLQVDVFCFNENC